MIYMKNRKKKMGFTLIELLITITVLALITSILYPILTGILEDAKEKTYKVQIKNITKATNDWIKKFPSALPEEEGEIITIQLSHLKKEGFIDKNIKNPMTKKPFPDDMTITITYINNKYIPTVEEKSGTTRFESPYKAMIVLKDKSYIEEEINSKTEFTDPGVIGYDENGQVLLDSSIVTTVRKAGEVVPSVDMGAKGTYELTYETSVNGKKIEAKRIIKVVDTTPPIITVPRNTTLDVSTSSFNVMEGVQAEDNSKEAIQVVAQGNVTLRVKGVYVVRYSAVDSSGNKREKKRTITIR